MQVAIAERNEGTGTNTTFLYLYLVPSLQTRLTYKGINLTF